MGYVDREANLRATYPVPVGPVLAAIEQWLEANSDGWVSRGRNHGKASPVTKLAALVKLSESACARQVYRLRNESAWMAVTTAERYLAAIDREDLWDTELRGLRPPLRFGADWMRPEERESPMAWKRRVVASWTPAERAAVGGAMASLLDAIRGEDDSRSARHKQLGRAYVFGKLAA